MITNFRNAALLLFLCICTVAAFGQTSGKQDRFTLAFASDPRKTEVVRTVVRGDVHFVQTDDLARFLSARTFVNPVLKKAEIILPTVRFKFSDGSPFVIITRVLNGTQNVFQLGAPAMFSGGSCMVPVNEFVKMFETEMRQRIIFSGSEPGKSAAPAEKSVITSQTPGQTKDPASSGDEQLSVGTDAKAGKFTVTGIDVEEKKNGYLLRIHATERLPDAEKTLQGGEWLYLTVPRGTADVARLGGMFPTGLVKRVIPVQSAQALQISFQFREKIESAEIVADRAGTDILVALRTVRAASGSTTSEPAVESVTPPKQLTAAETNAEKQKNKWKLDVIVLDAGHGGRDPGTIGSMGTHEKDVTLGIALKLGALIERNMPGVKVVYTRKTDTFVELYRRGQIANEAGGKLFISIHCNSTPKKATAANGFEIYLLRPGKTANAIEIAEQENGVVRLEKDFEYRYQTLTEENYIILTMAQSAYVKQSERFAEFLESEMAKKMVYQSRGVKQAGFYVLVGASMPNVLIEAGYLSNKKDESLLRGLPGQYLAAESIYDGLKKFKTEYESNFSED